MPNEKKFTRGTRLMDILQLDMADGDTLEVHQEQIGGA